MTNLHAFLASLIACKLLNVAHLARVAPQEGMRAVMGCTWGVYVRLLATTDHLKQDWFLEIHVGQLPAAGRTVWPSFSIPKVCS